MRDQDNKDTLFIVVPCYNEEECLNESCNRLLKKVGDMISQKTISPESRIVFVDDGSKDKTWKIIEELSQKDTLVRGVKLAHNVGHQNALLAGLEYSHNRCDITITVDADLQQDIEVLDKFVESYKNGHDIVFGVRNSRNTDGFIKKLTAETFYRIMNKTLNTGIIKNHADYRLISQKALTALLEYKEVNIFLRGIVTELGFSTDIVYFDTYDRYAGDSKYTFSKMLNLATNGITSFSIMPLHFIALMGIIFIFISFVMIIFFVVSRIMGNTVAGWTSILCSIWFLCGSIIFSIGVCGEYIGKTYFEAKHRPRYIIEKLTEEDKN